MTMPTRRGRDAVVPVTPVEALWISILAATAANTAAVETNTIELHQLREALTRDRRPAATSRDDDGLKLSLAAAVAGRAFSAREVIQHAAAVDGPLRAALDTAGLANARQLGKWLRSIEGRETGGLRLDRLGVDKSGRGVDLPDL
jgi:hypothetical protein